MLTRHYFFIALTSFGIALSSCASSGETMTTPFHFIDGMISEAHTLTCNTIDIEAGTQIFSTVNQAGLSKSGVYGVIPRECFSDMESHLTDVRVFISPRSSDRVFTLDGTFGVYVDIVIEQREGGRDGREADRLVTENLGVGIWNYSPPVGATI